MPLKRPTLGDVQKLHAEVNQIVNQRFALTTLAITIFTAFAAWLVPRDSAPSGPVFGLYRYFLLILLLIFEFLIFLLSHHLNSMLRVITVYLEVTDSSHWESDWKRYREMPPKYWSYSRPQALIFIVLGFLCGGVPLIFLVFRIEPDPMGGAVSLLVILSLYELFVIGIGFKGWGSKVTEIREKWLKIERQND